METTEGGRTFDAVWLTRPVARAASVAVAVLLVAYIALLAGVDPTEHLGMGAALVTAAMAALGVAVWSRNGVRPRRRSVRVDARAGVLRLDGGAWLPLRKIQNVSLTEDAGEPVLTFRTRWRAHTLALPSRREALELVDAVALGESARASVFALGGPPLLPTMVAACLVMLVGQVVFRHYPFLGRGVVLLLPAMPSLALKWMRSVTVARDGLSLQSPSGTRFVPHASITAVEVTPDKTRVVLRRADGGTLTLAVRVADAHAPRKGALLIADAIERARVAWSERAANRSESALALEGIADGGVARYRVASIPRERLLDVVEDPVMDVKVRVAAAEALRHDEDDDTRARLETVAATSASPEVRRAIGARR